MLAEIAGNRTANAANVMLAKNRRASLSTYPADFMTIFARPDDQRRGAIATP
jgi:hypothetical protein